MTLEEKDVNSVLNNKLVETTPPQNLLSHYKSSELFQGNNELIILHREEEYRLRITRHGKLILTK